MIACRKPGPRSRQPRRCCVRGAKSFIKYNVPSNPSRIAIRENRETQNETHPATRDSYTVNQMTGENMCMTELQSF